MITVELLGPIKREPFFVDVKNLAELADSLKQDEEISKWLAICAVAVNDQMVFSKETELKSGDKVTLLPPVCGG